MNWDDMFAAKPQLEAEIKRKAKLKRIERMHDLYGRKDDACCGDCVSFVRREFANTYFKCRRYSVSHSNVTDWRARYVACGKFEPRQEP